MQPGRGRDSAAARVVLTAIAPDGRQVYRGRVPEEGAAAPAARPRERDRRGDGRTGASASFDVRARASCSCGWSSRAAAAR